MVDTFRPLQLTTQALASRRRIATRSAGLTNKERRTPWQARTSTRSRRRSNGSSCSIRWSPTTSTPPGLPSGDMSLDHLRAFHRAVLGLLEPVPAGCAQSGHQCRHAAGRARVEGNPDERAGRHLHTTGGVNGGAPTPGSRLVRRRRSRRRSGARLDRRDGRRRQASASRRRTIEWLLRFGQPLGLASTTSASGGTARPARSASATSCSGCTAATTTTRPWAPRLRSKTGRRPGFWKELIAGLEKIKATQVPDLPLAFFTWHDKIENQHKAHVWDELQRMLRLAEVPRGAVHQRRRHDARWREGVLGRP